MNQPSNELVKFGDFDIEVVGPDGQKWAIANHVAAALGYPKLRSFRKLVTGMQENGELSEGGHFKYLPLPTRGGEQNTLVLSHRGVIRICMRSDAPNAIPFRDWAEDVLYKVMTEGHYEVPGLASVVTQLAARIDSTECNQALIIKTLETLSTTVVHINSRLLVPGEPDLSYWVTPSQRVRLLLSPEKPPKGFNSAGCFDVYAYQRLDTAGHCPRERKRYHIGKRSEYVIPPCPEVDALLREAYRSYLGVPEQRQLFAGHRVLRIARRKRHGKRG